MSTDDPCFISFENRIDRGQLPEKFTYPYHYQPHRLCKIAVEKLQSYLDAQHDEFHDFGLASHSEHASGKMFGVLVVETKQGEVGYLTAYSGTLSNQNIPTVFVPPVYDMTNHEDRFVKNQVEINDINAKISLLESDPNLVVLSDVLRDTQSQANSEIASLKAHIIDSRKWRKTQRIEAKSLYDEDKLNQIIEELNKQSIAQKNELKTCVRGWDQRIESAKKELDFLCHPIDVLKSERKARSKSMQNSLFEKYSFLNMEGETKNLLQLFESTVYKSPPAGAGDCAAPRLLQYAFLKELRPLAMAEFWWGQSPKSEVRLHKQFYGACIGKCKPILSHMLSGIELDDNPLLMNSGAACSIDILYQDDAMVIINKPAELLSVPGKHISDSVLTRMKALFPEANGPLIVHRLDMATSGLMVISLTKKANELLQKQFIRRSVTKRYIAILMGELSSDYGEVNLPLRGDFDDRPRQLVCLEHGKPASTEFKVISRGQGQTRVYFYPKTGRTHQLRMHAAHFEGLNTPILGDDLYGVKDKRLYLHAERLTLQHPITRQEMTFTVKPDF
jgi:tRNA pseudouridine32 synthase/23S rRNA pseudouridine746 synthase